jgi:hypothetical protein
MVNYYFVVSSISVELPSYIYMFVVYCYQGAKIHATIRKGLVSMFDSKIEEGQVYNMSYFSIFPQSGSYRTTLHPYKLVFHSRTMVELSKSSDITEYGLSITTLAEVCSHTHDYEFLVGK